MDLKQLVLYSLFIVLGLPAFGQTTDSLPVVSYDSYQEYEIGEVSVTGAHFTDENAIVSLSGLKVGDRITIPGDRFGKAITKLYKLGLFTQVRILKTKQIGDVVYLTIDVTERPRLSKYNFKGVRKGQTETLNEKLEPFLIKGSSVTTNTKQNAINAIKKYYREKGFLDVDVSVAEMMDNEKTNSISLTFTVDPHEKVKIKDIQFVGNKEVTSGKLRRKMKNIHRKSKIFAKSRLVNKEFEEDKTAIIDYYNTVGYRDAQITHDSIWRNDDGELMIRIFLEEGTQYFFRNITWKGNTIHDNKTLDSYLGIEKGDVYNKELLDQRLHYSPDGRDVSSLYLDDGYLFFRVDPVEVAIVGDSIDIEMRILEGPQATIDKVDIRGNTITHEHVIRREVFTRPGNKFSRSDIVRSQRQIIALGFFDPEKISMNTPINQERGTVDIEYVLEEKPSDQLELSAGWGGYSGVIGTLGFQFNNFSLRNITNRKAWRPLPKGDGQKLSIRAQTNSRFYQSYNFNFTEPWLGGKKANSFSLGAQYSKFDRTLFSQGVLAIGSIYTGLGTQLKWPDDFFVLSATANIENIVLQDYAYGGFYYNGQAVTDGRFNNFSLRLNLTRSTVFEPTFPRSGSRISVTAQLTPPYSLLNNKNYDEISIQDRFHFLEYHKWRIDAEWYATLVGKLVFRASAKMGYLGYYNSEVGISPFERFELGGDGLSNQTIGIQGKDILSLRGYEVSDIAVNSNSVGGGNIFNKYSLELRYPVSLEQNSTIYVLAFLDGGNSWLGGRNYRPFDLRRSSGLGLRVFLPMFGLLGFDYGFGWDKPSLISSGAKWTEFGKFSIVLGFEPD
ncbi:MAG: outer membrane protein assembly factor BamA [Lewinellaceae bacterium]|nr:outer membrane protein assembly factor BamA [Lewinellaceae bacterium]